LMPRAAGKFEGADRQILAFDSSRQRPIIAQSGRWQRIT
jgi:hypothetical protein